MLGAYEAKWVTETKQANTSRLNSFNGYHASGGDKAERT